MTQPVQNAGGAQQVNWQNPPAYTGFGGSGPGGSGGQTFQQAQGQPNGGTTDPNGQTWVPNVSGNSGWNGTNQWAPGQPSAPKGMWTGYNGGPQGVQGTPGGGTIGGSSQVGIPQNNGVFGPGVSPGAPPGGGPTGTAGQFYSNPSPGGPYNFAPTTGDQQGLASQGMVSPTLGQFGRGMSPTVGAQQAAQRFGVQNDINYGDYQRFGDIAQQYGQAGQNVLNDPRVAGAIAQQQQLAGGMSGDQSASIANLANAAAGRGPSAAQAQLTAGSEAAQKQALAQAGSARGNFGLANAQKNALAAGAETTQTSANQAAQLRAQEMQTAQAQYAGAAQGQYSGQVQAASAAQAGASAQENAAMNYYSQQQQALQHQSDMAAQLAQAQIANDYGLAGTTLQTQTQQNIANQQAQQAYIGAGMSGVGSLLAGMPRS